MTDPFNFDWGASIYAKVVATNMFGDSAESDPGNDAIIMTEPDSPVNIQEDIALRSATSISLTWQEGASNGGDQILDYRISYAHESNVYTVLAVGVTNAYFTATGLNAGLYYKFKVESRNYLFYSLPSDPIQILCATKPDIPTTIGTTNDADYVRVYWSEPANNGLPITSYTFMFRKWDDTYIEDAAYCQSDDSDLVANQFCTIPL